MFALAVECGAICYHTVPSVVVSAKNIRQENFCFLFFINVSEICVRCYRAKCEIFSDYSVLELAHLTVALLVVSSNNM